MKHDLMQIETTTACNAKCKMCPRDMATRSTHADKMPTRLFWSAVEQAYRLGVRRVLPFIDGEPLADSRMIDFVEGMARVFPDLEVGWYTNGSLLTAEKAERLLRAGNIKHFNVSMQGGNKETYESTMGLPWERTVENVERLVEIHKRLGSSAELRANMCVFGPTSESALAFRKRWSDLGMTICLGAFSNFGGLGHDEQGEAPWREVKRKICDRATKHLYVYHNGDVGQCCFDLVGSAIYGNLNKSTLQEIIDSDAYQRMRRAHFDIDVANMPPICRKCNACKFNG